MKYKCSILGSSKTGTSNVARSLVGPSFQKNDYMAAAKSVVQLGNDQLELLDISNEEKYKAFVPNALKESHIVLIVLDPKTIQNPYGDPIKEKLALVDKNASGAKVFFIINKYDTLAETEEFKKNCQTLIDSAKDSEKDLDVNNEIFYYSANKYAITEDFEVAREKNPLYLAIKRTLVDLADLADLHPLPENVTQQAQHYVKTQLTFNNFLILLFLFFSVTALSLSAGILAGGLADIWINLDGFVEAFFSLSPWGIGVPIAAMVFSLTVTIFFGFFSAQEEAAKLDSKFDSGGGYGDQISRKTTNIGQAKPLFPPNTPRGSDTKKQQLDTQKHHENSVF